MKQKVLCWLSIGLDRRTPSEHLLTGIFSSLRKQGNIVHVLQKNTAGNLPPLNQEMIDLGIITTLVPCAQTRKNNLVFRYLSDLWYVARCVKHLRKLRDVDAVFLQSSNVAGFQVFLLRRLLPSVRITYNVQDIFPENAVYLGTLSRRGILYRLLAATQRYAYRNVNQLITISEDMKDTLIEIGVLPEKIEVIYNWSYQDEVYEKDKVDFSPVSHIFQKEFINVVYAGNIGRMQNVELILQSAKLLKNNTNIKFHIIGDGVYKEKLVQKARETDADNVHFWPMMDASLAPSIYCHADINIISLAKDIYRTALPSKTATCIACQRPIIFCLGIESKFAKRCSESTNSIAISSSTPFELVAAIINCRQTATKTGNSVFFSKFFSVSKNSAKYAFLITEGPAERKKA